MVVEGHKVSFNPRTENRQSSFEIDLAKAHEADYRYAT